MSSYLAHVQQPRWVPCWSDQYGGSHYSIRLGNSGTNGAAVPSLPVSESIAITQWFLDHGIVRDAFDTDFWWSMEKFSRHISRSMGPDTTYEGGIEFRMSADAYRTLFPSKT